MRSRRSNVTLYILLMVIVVVFSALILILTFTAPHEEPTVTAAPPSVTASMLDPDASDPDALSFPDGGVVFRVRDPETLYLLADAGAFSEYYSLHNTEPMLVIEGDMTLDRTLEINCGIRIIVMGRLSWANDDIRIRIHTDGEQAIYINSNEPVSRLDIDAPESALFLSGGDIPFLREVAETLNVASYNGTPMTGAADGDTLGGTGKATAGAVTLYRDKKKTEVWDGAYSVSSGNLITLYVPHDVSDRDIKSLSISVDADGGICSTPDPVDLTSPALVSVTDGEGRSRTYRLTAERAELDIPVLSIYTDDGAPIDTKEYYKPARMTLEGVEYALSVRGRGNASWKIFPKHSYRLKLDSKASLCGMTSDRDWCLIGNYADPSLLRNKVASEMAKIMTALPFTPGYRSVDLFINGEYYGVFMLAEKIEEDEDRVPLGERVTDENGKIVDMGFLIEIGWDDTSENIVAKDYFHTTYCKYAYIKDPKITSAKNDEYQYIYNYVKAAETAIVKGDNYERWIDVDSWVDWFIVNELTNNSECAFHRSLYMYKPVGGKLTAGPIWDYDMAFGNNLIDIPDYNGWASVDFVCEYMYTNWMKFLVADESFMSRVRARWAEMKMSLMETAARTIEEGAAEIERSQVYNFRLWPKVLRYQIGMSRASTLGMRTWQAHVDYISEFLEMRYEWMDRKLS